MPLFKNSLFKKTSKEPDTVVACLLQRAGHTVSESREDPSKDDDKPEQGHQPATQPPPAQPTMFLGFNTRHAMVLANRLSTALNSGATPNTVAQARLTQNRPAVPLVSVPRQTCPPPGFNDTTDNARPTAALPPIFAGSNLPSVARQTSAPPGHEFPSPSPSPVSMEEDREAAAVEQKETVNRPQSCGPLHVLPGIEIYNKNIPTDYMLDSNMQVIDFTTARRPVQKVVHKLKVAPRRRCRPDDCSKKVKWYSMRVGEKAYMTLRGIYGSYSVPDGLNLEIHEVPQTIDSNEKKGDTDVAVSNEI